MADRKDTSTPEAKSQVWKASPGWSVAKRVIRIVVGIILIVLGLAALLTPLTPGSWLVPIGLELVGLRVLLRDRVCRWAATKPDSKLRKVLCRVFSLDGLEAMKRRWRSRAPKSPR